MYIRSANTARPIGNLFDPLGASSKSGEAKSRRQHGAWLVMRWCRIRPRKGQLQEFGCELKATRVSVSSPDFLPWRRNANLHKGEDDVRIIGYILGVHSKELVQH